MKYNWIQFRTALQEHPEMGLLFKYGEDQFVKASYHITEIKQAPITSVDCGGVVNRWTEVILQLMEPQNEKGTLMPVAKALSIISIVEKALALEPNALVKIEFGNSEFDTRQMLPAQISLQGSNLVVDLQADQVECKAIGRGGSCGTADDKDDCCAPSAEKPKMVLKNLAVADACCTPGSGCC